MTRDEFIRERLAASIAGRMDIVRVIAPATPLPEEALFRKVLDAKGAA